MEISRRVTTSALEEIDVGTLEAPRPLSITKDLKLAERVAMIILLWEYNNVFAWSHEEMKGLDPKFYQLQINLATLVTLPYESELRGTRKGRNQ